MQIYIYEHFNLIVEILGSVIFGVWILNYLFTCFTNPGIPSKEYFMSKKKRDYIEESESQIGYLTCSICNVFVKKNIQIGHCLTCKICILGKLFLLFTFFNYFKRLRSSLWLVRKVYRKRKYSFILDFFNFYLFILSF